MPATHCRGRCGPSFWYNKNAPVPHVNRTPDANFAWKRNLLGSWRTALVKPAVTEPPSTAAWSVGEGSQMPNGWRSVVPAWSCAGVSSHDGFALIRVGQRPATRAALRARPLWRGEQRLALGPLWPGEQRFALDPLPSWLRLACESDCEQRFARVPRTTPRTLPPHPALASAPFWKKTRCSSNE